MCCIAFEKNERSLPGVEGKAIGLLHIAVVFDGPGSIGEGEPRETTTGSIV
jgi:hypothetical protein